MDNNRYFTIHMTDETNEKVKSIKTYTDKFLYVTEQAINMNHLDYLDLSMHTRTQIRFDMNRIFTTINSMITRVKERTSKFEYFAKSEQFVLDESINLYKKYTTLESYFKIDDIREIYRLLMNMIWLDNRTVNHIKQQREHNLIYMVTEIFYNDMGEVSDCTTRVFKRYASARKAMEDEKQNLEKEYGVKRDSEGNVIENTDVTVFDADIDKAYYELYDNHRDEKTELNLILGVLEK